MSENRSSKNAIAKNAASIETYFILKPNCNYFLLPYEKNCKFKSLEELFKTGSGKKGG
jgi:hypothetical protein